MKFESAASAVIVDLATGKASGLDIDEDTIVNIENVVGGAGNDAITGSTGDNLLEGAGGNDTLTGGGGTDVLKGGLGDDLYRILATTGTTIVESAGEGTADRVTSSVSYTLAAGVEVELLTTNSSTATVAIDLHGNAFAQEIFGNAGANFLRDGGGAGDVLRGLGGDDVYSIYSSDTVVIESSAQGTLDKVTVAVDYVLGSGIYVEEMRTTSSAGTASLDLTGNELAQNIVGNAGTNVLHDGGPGAADTMSGLGGDDTYRVFNTADVVIEGATQGATDRVTAAVDYTLGAGVHVELLTTNGSMATTALKLTGNEIAQEIVGNYGDNRLEGKGGSDTLRGLAGKDSFVFATALGAANVDHITDFNVADDRFLMSDNVFTVLSTGTLTSSAFWSNTTGLAHDANDRIIYRTDTGEVFYDADGTGATAGVLFATITAGLALTNADFSVA